MTKEAGKKIGETKVSTYLVKNDNTLLRLNEAKVRMCTVPDDEAKSRGCTECDECEELVLVYRPFGCIKEKDEVNLNEMTTVSSKASPLFIVQKNMGNSRKLESFFREKSGVDGCFGSNYSTDLMDSLAGASYIRKFICFSVEYNVV